MLWDSYKRSPAIRSERSLILVVLPERPAMPRHPEQYAADRAWFARHMQARTRGSSGSGAGQGFGTGFRGAIRA